MPKLRATKHAQMASRGKRHASNLAVLALVRRVPEEDVLANDCFQLGRSTQVGVAPKEQPVGNGGAGVFGSPRSEGRGQTKQLPHLSRRIPYTPPPHDATVGETPTGVARGADASPSQRSKTHSKMVGGTGTNSIPSQGWALLERRLLRRCLRPWMWSLTCPSSRRRN